LIKTFRARSFLAAFKLISVILWVSIINFGEGDVAYMEVGGRAMHGAVAEKLNTVIYYM
jgi:hypothetical protein